MLHALQREDQTGTEGPLSNCALMQYDLGFFDHETDSVTGAENPFGAKVLPMCPE